MNRKEDQQQKESKVLQAQAQYALDTSMLMDDSVGKLKEQRWRYVINGLIFSVVILLIFFCIKKWLFSNFSVEGPSMESTYHEGDVVWVNKVKEPTYGDVVVIDMNKKDESGKDVYYIKRVIALGGDLLWVEKEEGEKTFYICRQKAGSEAEERLTEESYDGVMIEKIGKAHLQGILLHAIGKDSAYLVPDNTAFCLGDNRNNSTDSRNLGSFEEKDIEGVVVGEGMTVVWIVAAVAAAAFVIIVIYMIFTSVKERQKLDADEETASDGQSVREQSDEQIVADNIIIEGERPDGGKDNENQSDSVEQTDKPESTVFLKEDQADNER